LLQRSRAFRSSPYRPSNQLRRLPLLAGAAKVEQRVEAQELQARDQSETPRDEANSNPRRFPVSATNEILSAK
jgi:hypothetical protein